MHGDPAMEELFGPELRERGRREEERFQEREELLAATRNLLRAEWGKLFLFRLINETGVFTPSFTGNSETFYREGRRAVGLYLYRLLMQADPQALQKLIDYRREKQTAEGEAHD